MRVNHFAESMDDLPPPPYTPHDPAATGETALASPNVLAEPVHASLRGGYIRPSRTSARPSEESIPPSAANYFEGRQLASPNRDAHLNLIEHSITFFPDTTQDDLFFPLPTEAYVSRDLTAVDWSTFVNYLFPVLDKSASEKAGNEKGLNPRAFVEEDTPERRRRIMHVLAEWNEKFFSPRLIHITAEFASSHSRSIPVSSGSRNDGPVPVVQKGYTPPTRLRSRSCSSTSSSSSSSSSSIDSIKSRDMEGADINNLRSALLAFRLDPNKKDHLRQSVRQLRDEFRSQRRDLPHRERKELKREHKDQRKEVKREVKAAVKEIRATRKAERKLHKAERKNRRYSKRAETRGVDRLNRAQEKAQRQQDRAEEKALRWQARCTGAHERTADNAFRTRDGAAAQGCERARDFQPREPVAVGSAPSPPSPQQQRHAADTRARNQDAGAFAGEERARDPPEHDFADAGREKARLAEHLRPQDDAVDDRARGGSYGADAVARAHQIARYHQSRNYGADVAARAQDQARLAGQRARYQASGARGRDWGAYGREQARMAERNARQTVSEATRGL